jgi:predicted NAD/FAD-binding protein
VADIVRFNREAPALLLPCAPSFNLGDYLKHERYSRYFIEHYIIPMGAAIWSSRPVDMLAFPARFFVEFFSNHGFLSVNDRPTWRVIRGGSREYTKALTARYASRIRLNTPVASIARRAAGGAGRVHLRLRDGTVEHYDSVFLACHSDQALRLLSDPTQSELQVLGAIPYQENEALLHTDTRLMPRRRLAWAAWNYHLPLEPLARVTVTYNMNILQSLPSREQFLLTLNRSEAVNPARVIGRYVYHHPVYTAAAVAAQKRHHEIDGMRGTYYCGAYWGYGFHEDGVNSALKALQDFHRHHAQPYLQRVG